MLADDNAKQALRTAIELVGKGFSRHAWARDAAGEGVDVNDPEARSFSMRGALERAVADMELDYDDARMVLKAATNRANAALATEPPLEDLDYDIDAYNDQICSNAADATWVLRKAIAMIEAQEGLE